MKIFLLILLVVFFTGDIAAQKKMTDIEFAGLKGQVREIRTERVYTIFQRKPADGKSQLISTDFYDRRGFATQASRFSRGESRLYHKDVGDHKEVSREEFDESGKQIDMMPTCPNEEVINNKNGIPGFDYLYKFNYDAKNRIGGVTEYCKDGTVTGENTFRYNDKNHLISDIRCNPKSQVCEGSYYEYKNQFRSRQKLIKSVNRLEKCVSITLYSDPKFDAARNLVKVTGATTDCLDNTPVKYKFTETSKIEYYAKP